MALKYASIDAHDDVSPGKFIFRPWRDSDTIGARRASRLLESHGKLRV
jgi:hypothetical protein